MEKGCISCISYDYNDGYYCILSQEKSWFCLNNDYVEWKCIEKYEEQYEREKIENKGW